jgi:large subunit ribosomal protein L21
VLEVDRIPGATDDTVTFEEVLLVGDGDTITAGAPLVSGASVAAVNLGETRGPKIRVFKYKNKTRYRRTMGHRSELLRVRIDSIDLDGKRSKPAPRADKKAEPVAEEPTSATVVEAPVAAEVTDAAPKRTRKPAAAAPASETSAATDEAPAAEAAPETATETEEIKKPRASRKKPTPETDAE